MIELQLTFEHKPVNTFNFDKDTILIGRDPTCDIRIDNVGISRHHSRIERHGDTWVLMDLASGNGTFVKGKRITNYNLNSGDEINIWNYSLFFKTKGGAPKPATAAAPASVPKPAQPKPKKLDPEMTIALNAKDMDLKQRERSTGKYGHVEYDDPKRGRQVFTMMKTTAFLGSAPACEIKLTGWFIQPRHALFVRDEIGFRFINLAAKKTGQVNGRVVDDHRLKSGDIINIASRKFKFVEGLPSYK